MTTLRRAGLLLLLLAAAGGCGVVQPYTGPQTYGDFGHSHGA